jgi:hypothetical protein
LVLVTPALRMGGTVLARRLVDAGLVEGHDWIPCPFPAEQQ